MYSIVSFINYFIFVVQKIIIIMHLMFALIIFLLSQIIKTAENENYSLLKNFEIFESFYSMAREIEINIIDKFNTDSKKLDLVNEFTNNLKFGKPIVVFKEFVNLNKFEDSALNCKLKSEPLIDDDLWFNNSFLLKKHASNVHLIRIFIAENPRVLLEYFTSNPQNIHDKRKNSRGFTILLFSTDQCNSIGLITDLFSFLWHKLKVLQVVAQFPYSQENQDLILTFRPFIRKNRHGSCGSVKIYHYLDVIKYPQSLMNNVQNMNQCPMKISLFERNLTSFPIIPNFLKPSKIYKKIQKTSKLYGADGMAIANLAEFLNFSLQFYNGIPSYSTSLYLVINNEVDIQGNSRFLMLYDPPEGYEFTFMYNSAQLCLVVPKSKKLYKWMATLRIFKRSFSIIMLIILLLCGLINKILSNRKITYAISVQKLFSSLLGQSIRLGKSKNITFSYKIFWISFLLFCIVVSTIYSATLLSVYARETYLPDINTLEEFVQSDLTITSSINPFKDVNTNLYKALEKKLTNKLEDVEGKLSSIQLAAKLNVGGIERCSDAKLLIETEFSDKNGLPFMHIIPECVNSYFLSYVVPEGSPYLKIIDEYLMWINEIGLNTKWFEDFSYALIYDRKIQRLNEEKNYESDLNQYKKLNLEDIKGILFLLIIGDTFAFLVFFTELIICKLTSVA